MKKVIVLSMVFALALTASPVFAGYDRGGDNEIKIEVSNEDTSVSTAVLTVANTGANMVSGNAGIVGVGTGNAYAVTDVTSVVNSTNIEVKAVGRQIGEITVETENDDTAVENRVATLSNTGLNAVVGNVAYQTLDSTVTSSYNESSSASSEWEKECETRSRCHGNTECEESLETESDWSISTSNLETLHIVTPIGGDVTVITGDATSGTTIANVVNTTNIKVVRKGISRVQLPN